MTFSIVVVVSKGVENQSRKEVFLNTLENLINQDFPKSGFKVIIVDSGSGLSREDWQNISQKSSSQGNEVTIIDGQGNIGPARARNLALKAIEVGQTKIKPEIVAFTDDDTLVPQNWLKSLEKAFLENPAAAGAGGISLPEESEVKNNIFAAHDEYLYAKYFPQGRRDLDRLRQGFLSTYPSRKVLEHPVFSGNIAYHRESFNLVGGFDENYKAGVYGEDASLKEKILSQAGFLVFVPMVNRHLAVYNFKRFRAQQEGRGRGIMKFRHDHNLYPQTTKELYLRLFLSPLTFPLYLIKTRFNLKISFLESLGYFFRQIGKLKHTKQLTIDNGQLTREEKQKIKILFLDHTPLVGGAQLALLRHLKYLDRLRFNPSVVVGRGGPMSERFKKLQDLEVLELDFPKLKVINPFIFVFFLISAVHLLWLLRGRKTDLLVANTERSFYICFLVSLILRRPLVLMVRDFRFSKFLLRILDFKISKYLCVSKKIAEYYKLSQAKTDVVYVGSDLLEKSAKVSGTEVAEIKNSLGIKPGTLVVGFVGRLIEWKGPRLLLESFSKIVKEGAATPIHLIIVGEGPMRAELEEHILRNGLWSFVSLVGQVEDVEVWYKVFDIFVQASAGPEPFATTVVEAALCGLPILATRTGGTEEFIEGEKTGLLVEPAVEALAAGLRRLTTKVDLRKRLGEAALTKASKEFSEGRVTKKCEEHYEDLVVLAN